MAGLTRLLGAQSLGSITGTVRDSAGVPIVGAEVTVERRVALTNLQGAFRLDSLRLGDALITIRLVGYAPHRAPITVRRETSEYVYVLHRAAYLLPTLVAEAHKAGIYGTVGDTSLKALSGVKVQLAGRGGEEAVTDSSGRFAFLSAGRGQYLVRIVHPGYAESRQFVELKRDEGVELAIRLRPSARFMARAEQEAFHDLGRRLASNLPRDRLTAGQLDRYGSQGLCGIPEIAARVRHARDTLTIIINGTFILKTQSVGELCSWRAEEVELVEFGESVCRDITRSLVELLHIWCSNLTGKERGPERVRPIRTQRRPGPFVVIWEKR